MWIFGIIVLLSLRSTLPSLLVHSHLVPNRYTLSAENLSLETVVILEGTEEGHGLVEEVEGVDDHNPGLR